MPCGGLRSCRGCLSAPRFALSSAEVCQHLPGLRRSSCLAFFKASQEGREVASVKERVIEIVSEQLGVNKDQINDETHFVNDIGADSLDTVELVMELEEEFDINIPDDAAEKIQTVGEAVHYIELAVAK